jgi:hypothetical protein
VKPPQNQQQGNFRSPNFQQQNARIDAPTPACTNNDGRCYNCGKPGHFMNACSHPRKQNQGRGQSQNNKDKGKKQTVQVKQGRLNITTMVGIPEGAAVMMGTFSIHGKPVKILFDSGATHSFMNQSTQVN